MGPQLPERVIRVGDVSIGPIIADSYPKRLPDPPINFSLYPVHLRVRLASVEVGGACWIVIRDVEADEPDAALYKVKRDILPPVMAALSAGVASDPYHVEVMGLEGASRGAGNYEYSAVQSFKYFEPTDLDRDTVALLLGRWRHTYEEEGPLRTAADAFVRGMRSATDSSGIEGTSASILAFFQVIEACVNVAPWNPPPELEEQQVEVLRQLRDELDSSKVVKQKVSSVHSSSDALKRLRNSFLDLRMEHAAGVLGLGGEWLDSARALKKTRDQELGHNKGVPSEAKLEVWRHNPDNASSAYTLAMRALRSATQYALESPSSFDRPS